MKKLLAAGAIAIGVAFMGAAPAMASSADSHASTCGATHGAFADVNLNFGWLGPLGGTPGYHGAVGQEPGATGYNNSTASAAVCQP